MSTKMKRNILFAAMAAMLEFAFVFGGCASQSGSAAPTGETVGGQPSQAAAPASSGSMSLDEAIAQAAAQMEARLPARTEVALISVSSPSASFSQYVLDGLEAALVRSGNLVVVDRANLDKVRAELGFQMTGEVSDASAKSIGQMVGAGAIVTGSLSNIGTLFRLTFKAIEVERAVVAVSFPADIANDERVRALLGQGGNAALPRSSAQQNSTQGTAAGSGTAQAPAAPARPVIQAAPGALYVGDALQGEMDLLDALDWIGLNAKSGGKYTIALGRDEAITPTELSYGGKTLTITLKSAGGEHTVSFEGANPSYSLFNVKSGVTFTLEDGVTLRGTQNSAAKSLVEVTGGRFVMNGGAITGNKEHNRGGGGVYMASGTFTMNGGTISGNTTSGDRGGGVYVASGSFTMSGGVINENTSGSLFTGEGGGVYVKGTFTMSGGTISGNTSRRTLGGGGGVYVQGTFTMNGGTISGNTSGKGGGVYVEGTFTMREGTISGNTADNLAGSGYGGGVYVTGTSFTMSGGSISGNTANSGGGVYVERAIFTKSGKGGVIYGSNADEANRARADDQGHAVYWYYPYNDSKKRNTTARAATAMDSTKNGPAGGWE
ncbi:hypothetical protein AGMMS50268_31640 [Spirochaetia bacterium]|nr:hypothetical protein AGMMS50268_31640 [Spirochaetia bacterium]